MGAWGRLFNTLPIACPSWCHRLLDLWLGASYQADQLSFGNRDPQFALGCCVNAGCVNIGMEWASLRMSKTVCDHMVGTVGEC